MNGSTLMDAAFDAYTEFRMMSFLIQVVACGLVLVMVAIDAFLPSLEWLKWSQRLGYVVIALIYTVLGISVVIMSRVSGERYSCRPELPAPKPSGPNAAPLCARV
jgi:hypothetical protein